MKLMILTRKKLIVMGCCVLMAVVTLAVSLGSYGRAIETSTSERKIPIYNVDTTEKVCAISFDAAWGNEQTETLLEILDKYKIKSTFFLVGQWVDKYPEDVKAIYDAGHDVGNHSDTHAHLPQLDKNGILKELQSCNDKVKAITGKCPTLFRPPYGDYNNRVVQVSRAEGYEAVQWSIDSLDWKDRGTQDIIKRCTYKVENGDIVLFHNDSNDIVNALPTVIQHYQGLGYTIVPVGQLILTGDYTIDVQGKQHPVQTTQPTQEPQQT